MLHSAKTGFLVACCTGLVGMLVGRYLAGDSVKEHVRVERWGLEGMKCSQVNQVDLVRMLHDLTLRTQLAVPSTTQESSSAPGNGNAKSLLGVLGRL